MSPTRALVFLVAALAATSARAVSWDYAMSVPDGLPGTFDLPFPVDYSGAVTIEASWEGPRLLFFGVAGPDHEILARRSGPSPQRLTLSADAALLAKGESWTLTVKALAARGGVEGKIRVTVPDAPDVVQKREAELHPPPPPPPPPPAWTQPRPAPAGAPVAVRGVYDAVEALRGLVFASDAPPDSCGWQRDLVQFAAAARDRLGSAGAAPDIPSLRYFARLSDATSAVRGLAASKDPILAGPVPDDRDLRREWLIARYELTQPIERRLDELTELLRGGHAPTLEDERWIPRFIACLTACERYFDERVRLGGEGNAPNRELADAQWSRILAAGHVFSAFAPFLAEPPSAP
jgi:hypothetical protein